MCVCENWNWAPAVRPRRIGYRKWYEPKRQWCWLLQCIVMAALTKGLPSACILLEKIRKKKTNTKNESSTIIYSNWKQRILYFHGEARWDCTPASTMQKNVQCRLKKIKRTPRHLKLRSSSPVHPNRDFARALERLRQWLCIGCNFLNVIWFPSL